MNRTLIIGGTGTVGRHVLSQLSALGMQIRVLAPGGLFGPVATQRAFGDAIIVATRPTVLNTIGQSR
jgi:uncharacterized protein YbjT (DUF2867 family)